MGKPSAFSTYGFCIRACWHCYTAYFFITSSSGQHVLQTYTNGFVFWKGSVFSLLLFSLCFCLWFRDLSVFCTVLCLLHSMVYVYGRVTFFYFFSCWFFSLADCIFYQLAFLLSILY